MFGHLVNTLIVLLLRLQNETFTQLINSIEVVYGHSNNKIIEIESFKAWKCLDKYLPNISDKI